jgi:hypothetical protein
MGSQVGLLASSNSPGNTFCFSLTKFQITHILPVNSTLVQAGITPATQPEVEGQTGGQITGGQTTGGSIGKMTDEIYIEILAQTTYNLQKYAQDLPSFASRMKVFYGKYDVTAENFEAYEEALKDPTRAQAVAQKYAQRLQELQTTGK